ncbi:MAG: PilZ domain-containing protein [Candidatus Omnitrophica bacterium]|jgi:c-di-GMP-binding flagellar brake protein YcgR|nr:PilZ domain-containing protein [Candidatus Omnitrophota bacterium]MDD5078863.1 PilZ domain-containing protein [Candidatus Omnitrophota bacterium]
MDNVPERRKFTRALLFAEIIFKRRKTPDEPGQVSITRNIGRGGLCIISSIKLDDGEILDLSISLPQEDKAIEVASRVVWVKEYTISETIQAKRYTVGVEFFGGSELAMEKIDRYIASHNNPGKS